MQVENDFGGNKHSVKLLNQSNGLRGRSSKQVFLYNKPVIKTQMERRPAKKTSVKHADVLQVWKTHMYFLLWKNSPLTTIS